MTTLAVGDLPVGVRARFKHFVFELRYRYRPFREGTGIGDQLTGFVVQFA
jgi:hypothetical protein